MRIYLAAPYGSREQIRAYASDARAVDLTVTSSWLDEAHEINAGTQGAATALSDEQVSLHALTDIGEVIGSDVLVLFTAAYVGCEGGGGRHVETGVALATGIPVIVVGDPENVFHRITDQIAMRRVPDWATALVLVDSMGGARA